MRATPQELATRYGIPRVFRDYRDMLKESDIEMVTITAPNSLHKQMTCDIAAPASTWFAKSLCA